jgi:hypothetical protein
MTKTMKALPISKINHNKFYFSDRLKKGKLSILYDNTIFNFQSPFMIVKDELSFNNINTDIAGIGSMDTHFKGESKRKINNFYSFIDTFEENMVEHMKSNSILKYFKEKGIFIKSMIRGTGTSVDNLYIRWLIDTNKTIFIDESNDKLIDPSSIKKGDMIRNIVEIKDIWIREKQFGFYPIVKKVLVRFVTSEYSFDEESDASANEDKLIDLIATEQRPKPKSSLKNKSDQQSSISNSKSGNNSGNSGTNKTVMFEHIFTKDNNKMVNKSNNSVSTKSKSPIKSACKNIDIESTDNKNEIISDIGDLILDDDDASDNIDRDNNVDPDNIDIDIDIDDFS